MPTVGQWPPGKNRPRSSRYGPSSTPPWTAGDAETTWVASSYDEVPEQPEVDDERVGADRPLRPAVTAGADGDLPAVRLASRTASTTSASVCGVTTAAG